MKKTLALVLALVMVIGLMAVPVKADFTDSSAIEYTEAVDVLSAVGVINGFENGSFDPAGNLTREQAAKIVAYLLLGEKNADALVATSAPFGDVAADRWSAGYIAYCVNEGIINGRDANTFDPTGKVTGYEFAKLLLGCLGYSSKIEQYVGASWAINVAKTALDIDLFDGNDGANYNAPMTREEAALYAFNTLKATLVDYDSQGTSIDLGNGVVISTGASKAEVVAQGSYDNNMEADDLQFAEKYFDDLEYDAESNDDFNRPATAWVYDNEDVGTYAAEADFTYTAAVEIQDIFDDMGEPDDAAFNVVTYVDGTVSAIDEDDFTTTNDDELGGNGTLVEVYEVDDYDYVVVIINTYVGEISNWTEADEEDDVDEYVTVTNLTSAAGTAAADLKDGKFETTVFTEDDSDDETVVLYTASSSTGADYEIQSVVAAESVEATPSRFTTTKSFVAGGTTYKYAANVDDVVDTAMVNAEDDVTIYLDSYGYAITVVEIEASADNFAYVINALDDDSDLFGDPVHKAKLLLETGEVVIVEIEDAIAGFAGDIVKYSVDSDDVYDLTSVADSDPYDGVDDNDGAGPGVADGFNVLDITKGKSAVTIGNNLTRYANSKTIFFVEGEDSDGDPTYDVYVGIANVPSVAAIDGSNIAYSADGTTLEAVYVSDADEDSTATDDAVYIHFDGSVDPSSDVDLGTYYEFEVVNGDSIETMMFDADLVSVDANGDGDFADVGDTDSVIDGDMLVESVDVNEDGVVTAIGDDLDDSYTAIATVKAEDGVIGFADALFTYADDAAVYKVEDDEIAASSITAIKTDGDNTVFYVLDDDGIVTAIYYTIVD